MTLNRIPHLSNNDDIAVNRTRLYRILLTNNYNNNHLVCARLQNNARVHMIALSLF